MLKFLKIFFLSLFLFSIYLLFSCSPNKSNITYTKEKPLIEPDYNEIIIPPNICPLNFCIKEKGNAYFVKIYGKKGKSINILSHKKLIKIPIKKWHKILGLNLGDTINIEIIVKKNFHNWVRYQPLSIFIASDSIDPVIVYRKIDPGFRFWNKMGIFQRDIETFNEIPIISNQATRGNCMNCHSFNNHNPAKMLFHLRALNPGTIIIDNDKIQKVNLSTPYTMSYGVYPSWHPNKQYIAFSVNIIRQIFFAQFNHYIEVIDYASDIVIYDYLKNIITTCGSLSTKLKENLPEWAPDGKHLYYILGDTSDDIKKNRYSLMRIPFDTNNLSFGQPEMLINADSVGYSISFPKISPNNRFIVFCALDFGYFAVNHRESDLWLFDISNFKAKPLTKINSTESESYHSWSSNSRWLIFSSKRDDGFSSYPYICYIDSFGNDYKPFLLPQKDPNYYKFIYSSFNVPEFVKGKVFFSLTKLKQIALNNKAKSVTFDSSVNIDGLSGATWLAKKKNYPK